MQESIKAKKLRAEKIFKILKKEYPDAKSSLNYKNLFELFVVVPLSAQTTDINVNKVSKKLFQKIKNIHDLANISQSELEEIIRSLGFFRQKSKNLRNAAKMIISDFEGKIPDSMEDLIKLPGIARKTANIILESGFNKVEGIAVDTHVKRISKKLNLTENENPDKVEKDLKEVFLKSYWGEINHLMVFHGRKICTARKEKCEICSLFPYCPGRKII
ncbi:MAG: endonuclease III [Minisyncoccales bacterium]